MFGPSREKEQRLGARRHLVGKQKAADLFAERRSARLARAHDLMARCPEEALEPVDLRPAPSMPSKEIKRPLAILLNSDPKHLGPHASARPGIVTDQDAAPRRKSDAL